MPQAPAPNSGGRPEPENTAGSGGGYLPQGKPGGEIIISRAEAAALTAFEADDDHGRAGRESGLTADQLRRLRSRADSLRSKGYTLKSGQATFKPKNYENSDEPGLLGKKEIERDKARKATPAKAATKEAGSESSFGALVAAKKASVARGRQRLRRG